MAKLVEITGKALSGEWGSDDDAGTGIPVLRTTNFTNEGVIDFSNVATRNIEKKNITEKYLRHGDIIIEKSGGSDKQPVGRVVFFEGREKTYLFNNFTGVLRVKNTTRWMPRYIFYALFAQYLAGGTRPFENRTTGLHNLQTDAYINSVVINDKTVEEQKQICVSLDTVCRIISKRMIQLTMLDDLINSRFAEMFGDPVTNPKGWDKRVLSDEAEIRIGPFGSLLHKGDYIAGGHALVNPSHIIDGKIEPDDELTVSDDKYAELSAYHLFEGDVVMGRRGEMGRCAVVEQSGLLCGTGSLIVRSYGDLSADFLHKIISFPSFKRTIEDMAVGQTMPNLNVPIVSSFQIIKPPKRVQEQYYAFVAQIDRIKADIETSLAETQTLFDSLMQQYFG